MATKDVEKRLNLSLDDLISESKKGASTRGGKAAGRGRGGRANPTAAAKESQKKSSEKRQNVLAAKRGLKAGAGEAGVQKAGRKAGKVIAVPIRGRGKGRGGAGRGGGSGRGATNGTAQPSLHPASLKITIRNDRYVPEEQRMAAVPWGSAAASQPGGNAYAANGRPVLEVGGFYSHQPAAGALTGGAARAQAAGYRPVFAGPGGFYAAAPRAAAAAAGTAVQAAPRAAYGSGSLRMDEL